MYVIHSAKKYLLDRIRQKSQIKCTGKNTSYDEKNNSLTTQKAFFWSVTENAKQKAFFLVLI